MVGGKFSSLDTLRDTFHLLTCTLFSLLLPLSFLLLARFSTAYFLLSLNHSHPSLLFSIFLYANPIHPLVSAIGVATLIHAFSSTRISLVSRPRLYAAWIMLCLLHLCVGLGIEGSIGAAGIDDGFEFGKGTSYLCRLIFFLGLHETMVFWWRTVVKPVVDDTLFCFEMEEKWVERVVISVSFGSLWWWRLREEVESLVVVVELMREMDVGVGVAPFPFIGWWLYYLTVTIGMVRVVKGIIWFGMILLCNSSSSHEPLEAEEKV